MKKLTWVIQGVMVMITVCLFTQCANNQAVPNSSLASANGTTMKIAYVDIDSLLNNYNLCKDLNEIIINKQENAAATLNEKGVAFEAEVREYNRKLENNVFTRERAEQENSRLVKRQQELQELQNRLDSEIIQETQKNTERLRDSISAFIKDYNAEKGFDLIITNTGFDNLLYANPNYNITKEIIDGLNTRYTVK